MKEWFNNLSRGARFALIAACIPPALIMFVFVAAFALTNWVTGLLFVSALAALIGYGISKID